MDLLQYLQSRVPAARLVATVLPQAPEITLDLLSADYPQQQLSQEQAVALMEAPPYWSFCWASGQVSARWILDNAQLVRGRTVVDFGAGSGVVGIAAVLAGAKRVIAVDNDPYALRACAANAAMNKIEMEYCAELDELAALLGEEQGTALICIADVFYDRENLPLLEGFKRAFGAVLVADSRLGGRELPGIQLVGRFDSFTVPDLNESGEFNSVCLYFGA